MTTLPKCPSCSSEYTYEDGAMYVCPECAHEWPASAAESTEVANVVRDAFGSELKDGDSVTVIKDLKIKGGRLWWSRCSTRRSTSGSSRETTISTARSTV